MANGICAGCQKDTFLKAKGYCRACYQQWKRTGSVERERQPRGMCSVEGCTNEAHGRGLCHMHLKRLKVSGTFDDPRADNVNLRTNQKLYAQWQEYQRADAYPIVPEWKADFFAFMAGVGERPSSAHRLYRLNKSLPMGPENFEWREKMVTRRADETANEYESRHNYARRERFGRRQRDSELKRLYGPDFGLEQLRALEEAQNGLCAVCAGTETSSRDGLVLPLAVDHDHRPGGKVRGLLCQSCNTGLGKFKDDPEILAKAIAYLAKHAKVHA